MTAYQLKPWTQIVTPHQDIIEGNLDNSVFAASLSQVVRQDPHCPSVYRNAYQFFEATYLTKELRSLLTDVLKGLSGEMIDKILQLRTPFGGGKTHALISLYHLTKHRHDLYSFPELINLPDPGITKVASFIGLDMGASNGIKVESGQQILTPWGYIAWQLGGEQAYQLVATEDQQRIAPGNDTLRQLIGSDPVLILIDEFLVYVENAMALPVGDSTFGRQVLTFMQRLTEVVRELPKTVLVYSLQASVQEAIGNEGLLNVLDKLVSRLDAKKEPVSGDEVMKVVQRRLFQDLGDSEQIKEIARQQAELYRRFYLTYAQGTQAQQEVEAQAQILAERIESSYPFHPDLLDLMYYRWGSLPSYQRTRGALQFLARTVAQLWQNNDPHWLITPGSIPLEDVNVKQAFFSQVGQRDAYNSVISADLIGRKAKAKIVDQRIASDVPALSNIKVATRLATAILMYSFGAKSGEDTGVMEQEVAASCLGENLDRTTLTAVLSDIRDELLYLHYVGKKYRFETKPNLNKLIVDEESKVNSEEVLTRVRQQLETNLKNGQGEMVIWAKESSQIPDRLTKFIVIYLDETWAEKSTETLLQDAMKWLEYRGKDKREYKNCLAFIVPNSQQMEKARNNGRTLEAITNLLVQKQKYQFSLEQIEELKEKENNAKSGLKSAIDRLYEQILLPIPDRENNSPITFKNIDLQAQLNTSKNLQERVFNALNNDVFSSLTVNKLVSLTVNELIRLSGINTENKTYLKVNDLISYFFKFPDYPKLLNQEAIIQAILEAIATGKLGYIPQLTINDAEEILVEKPELLSINTKINPQELDLSGYLLEPHYVTEILASYQAQQTQNKQTEDLENKEKETEKVTVEYSTTSPSSSVKELGNYQTEKATGSSIERRVLVDIVEGRKEAKHYRLTAQLKADQLFELVGILQNLTDISERVDVQITLDAYTKDKFDLQWLRNAIEEPLDEAEIQATTRLE